MSEKPVKAEKPRKTKSDLINPDEAKPYRRAIWSRDTLQFTVPKHVRNAAIKQFGVKVGDKTFAVKVTWDEDQKAIIAVLVPIAEAGFNAKEP